MRTYCVALLLVLLTACGGGGGGGGGNPIPPAPVLLAPERYFPSRIGSQYTYRLTTLDLPFLPGENEDMVYNVQANPFGPGVYYNLVNTDGADDGPHFEGLRFTSMIHDTADNLSFGGSGILDAGAAPEVLPAVLTGLGQQWASDFSIRNITDHLFRITGSSRLAAVEDLTLGGTTFSDCLRVDVQLSYSHDRGNDGSIEQDIPLVTGSYWLAPDIGPVRGVARVAGVTVGEVQLVSAFTL